MTHTQFDSAVSQLEKTETYSVYFNSGQLILNIPPYCTSWSQDAVYVKAGNKKLRFNISNIVLIETT